MRPASTPTTRAFADAVLELQALALGGGFVKGRVRSRCGCMGCLELSCLGRLGKLSPAQRHRLGWRS